MNTATRPGGDLLREWRQRRRLSQLELALDADVSAKHLSFVETGRSAPSREMVLHLAEQLEVPLRERNVLLIAAGFAPLFRERALADPALDAARQAVDLVLAGHEPHPALAVDHHWNLVSANRAVTPFLTVTEPALLQAPVNVLRLSLHPGGLAPRIANLAEWRSHLFARLRRQVEVSADLALVELLRELDAYPGAGTAGSNGADSQYAGVVVPLRLISPSGVLSFISTTTVFGTPMDITLSELALESFFPADAFTAETLRRLADARSAAESRRAA